MHKTVGNKLFLWLLLAGVFAYSIFLHYYFMMSASWDTANYHYYSGWMVASHNFYRWGAIAGYNTFLNPLCDYFNYITYHYSAYLGAFCQSILFTANLYLIYSISLKIFPGKNLLFNQFLALAACIIAGTAANGIHLDTFSNDIPTAMFILLSLRLAIPLLKSESGKWLILMSGFFAGAAVGLKLTTAPYALGIWVSIACLSKNRIKTITFFTLGALLGYFAFEGYFWVLRWEQYKNPLFPMANNIFHSPYSSPGWFSINHWHWEKLGLYLTLPIRWLYSAPFSPMKELRDGRILLGFIGIFALLFSCFLGSKNIFRREVLLLVITFLVGWIFWLLVFRVFRYLLVLNLISGILLILGLIEIKLISIEKKIVAILSLAVIGIFLFLTTAYPIGSTRKWKKQYIDASIPFKLHQGQLVLVAGGRLSFLVPLLAKDHVAVANFHTQSWNNKRNWLREPFPVNLTHINIKNVFVLVMGNNDPSADSEIFSNFTKGYELNCSAVSNNFHLRKIKLCRYQKSL